MIRRYCVEVSHELITPVIVEAENNAEAIELVLNQCGESGDAYDGVSKVVSVRCLDDE